MSKDLTRMHVPSATATKNHTNALILCVLVLLCFIGVGSAAPCDYDNDGYNSSNVTCGGTDCNDSNADVNPGETENTSNYVDDDCDGWINRSTFDVRSEHPRLLLTDEKMEFVMAKVNANDADWQGLNANRNSFISGAMPFDVQKFLLKWALLYKITGNTTFLNRTCEALWDYNVLDEFWVGGYRGYTQRDGFRSGAEEYILVYDWLYADFNDTQRQDYEDHIVTWNEYWKNYCDYEGGFQNCPNTGTAYRWGDTDETKMLMLHALEMGVVLFGENENASQTINMSEAIWDEIEVRFWSRMGGIPCEGTYYGWETRGLVLRYLLALETGLGDDKTDDAGHNYTRMLNESTRFVAHATSPDGEWTYPFGDIQMPEKYGICTNMSRVVYYPLMLSELFNGTQDAEYMRYWVNETYDLPYTTSTDNYIKEMLYNDRVSTKTNYNASMSNEFLSEDGDFMFYRDSWDYSEDLIWWGFRYAPYHIDRDELDHVSFDALSYQIMRGDDFVTKELIGYSGASEEGRAHNTVVVQRKPSTYCDGDYCGGGFINTDGVPTLETYMFNDNFTYIYVDASLYYSAANNIYWESRAINVSRKFVHIKPDKFIVFDHVLTNDIINASHKAVVNHFEHEPTLTGANLSSYEGSSNITVKYLLPLDMNITVIDESVLYAGEPAYQVPDDAKRWQTLTESLSNPAQVNYLHLIEVGDNAATEIPNSSLISATDGQGIRVNTSTFVLLSKDFDEINATEYTLSGTGNVNHLILDLTPNTTFNVTDNTVLIETLDSAANGFIQFSASLSSDHTYSIFEGTSGFTPDTTKTYYNPTSPIQNVVNSTGYNLWNRTIILNDQECAFNIEVTA